MSVKPTEATAKNESNLVSTSIKSVGVIGSRKLPHTLANRVGNVVEDLIARNYHIATGGAIGADQFVIERLLRQGLSDHCTVYSAWQNYAGFPIKVRAMMRQFKGYGENGAFASQSKASRSLLWACGFHRCILKRISFHDQKSNFQASHCCCFSS